MGWIPEKGEIEVLRRNFSYVVIIVLCMIIKVLYGDVEELHKKIETRDQETIRKAEMDRQIWQTGYLSVTSLLLPRAADSIAIPRYPGKK